MKALPLLLSLGVFACDNATDPFPEPKVTDVDNDGFDPTLDCDDQDATVNPNAVEYCDGIDNDCSGEVDGADAIEAVPFYADADADGFGDPDHIQLACEAPNEFFLENALDCDDTDAEIFPGGVEYCDALDNDCDGSFDEEDAVDEPVWYGDADGDGYGDAAITTQSCTLPVGFSDNALDCFDHLAEANPGATEVCNDGIDNDCDASAFPCGTSGEKTFASAEVTFLGGEDDSLGIALAAGDVTGDGVVDLAIKAGDASDYYSTAGGTIYLFPGPLDSAGIKDAPTSAAATISVSLPYSYYATASGSSLVLEDVDADGLDDVLMGSVASYGGGSSTSGVYVFLAPVAGSLSPMDADYALTGSSAQMALGNQVQALGDLDGDGQDDFAAAIPTRGIVHLIEGPLDSSMTTAEMPLTVSEACIPYGGGGYCSAQGQFGTHVSGAGDLDGDGQDDLVVGAPNTSVSGGYTMEGKVYAFSGPITTTLDTDAAVGTIDGERQYGFFGTSFDIVPDVNGDGYDDLVWGDGYNDYYYASGKDPGRAGIVFGPVDGELTVSTTDLQVEGDPGDGTGSSAIAMDANGDGIVDLLVSDTDEDGDYARAGAVFTVYGPLESGTLSLGDAGGRIVGVGADEVGGALIRAGDVNQDGFEDVAVGAPEHQSTLAGQGAAFVVFGGGM